MRNRPTVTGQDAERLVEMINNNNKSQSEIIMSIRNKFQEQMKNEQVNYQDILEYNKNDTVLPHLKVKDGSVVIDHNNSLQERWFKNFKR